MNLCMWFLHKQETEISLIVLFCRCEEEKGDCCKCRVNPAGLYSVHDINRRHR